MNNLDHQCLKIIQYIEETGKNLLITGKAGTGKSTLLEHLCTTTQKNCVALAPTGVAALNIKGQTIHRFFNFHVDVTVEKIVSKDIRPKNPKLYEKIEMIIIDEISMVRADLMDCIDIFLRMYGPSSQEVFGGIQMVFVGDLYQLAPVVKREEQDVFTTHYKTPYFFSAQAIESFCFEVVELTHIYRQKDADFIGLLDKIRYNSLDEGDLKIFNQKCQNGDFLKQDELSIHLTTTNQKAEAINHNRLEDLEGRLYTNQALIKGSFTQEYYPTALDLQYKVGSQIMLLNNDLKNRWVNGSIGKIESIQKNAENEEYLKVKLCEQQKSISVVPFEWEVYKFFVENGRILSEPVGSFTQYPFRLAWAVTIHKSQGKTFERVEVDLGNQILFTGQAYVALSRCTSFEGMRLITPLKKCHIRTDSRIGSFLRQKTKVNF